MNDAKYSIETFQPALELLSTAVRNVVLSVLEEVHPSFWTAPASKSGRYHPQSSLGVGGLIRHTVRAIQFFTKVRAKDTFKLTEREFELGVAALVVHDTFKHDYAHHHRRAANEIYEKASKGGLPLEDCEKLKLMVGCHAGPFSDGYGHMWPNVPMYCVAVYMADLYSAQRWLEK